MHSVNMSSVFMIHKVIPPPQENHFLLHIVTRWKRDESGIRMERNGMPMLEFVAVKTDKRDKLWGIPEAQFEKKGSSALASDNIEPESPVRMWAFNKKNFRSGISSVKPPSHNSIA